MFRSILTAGVLMIALVFTPLAIAGEREDLDELAALTGFTTVFDGIDKDWGEIGASKLVDEKTRDAWQSAAKQALVPSAMRDQAMSVLPGALSEAERSDLLAFYRSDFGRKVTALEIAAQHNDDSDAGQKVLDGATEARKALLTEVFKASQSEISRDMFIEAIRSMMLAEVIATARGSHPVDLDEANARIDARIKQISPAILAEFDKDEMRDMAYTYQDLSDDEMRTYLAFLHTAPAEKFIELGTYGISMAVDTSLSALGTGFVTRMQSIGS